MQDVLELDGKKVVRVVSTNDRGRTRIRYVEIDKDYTSKRANGLACPMIADDSLPDGTYSGADGQIYTSKAALRASYLPSGNPDGIRYEEVGNETIKSDPLWQKGLSDKAIDESLGKAAARLGVDL